jgi:hypothetical protein
MRDSLQDHPPAASEARQSNVSVAEGRPTKGHQGAIFGGAELLREIHQHGGEQDDRQRANVPATSEPTAATDSATPALPFLAS